MVGKNLANTDSGDLSNVDKDFQDLLDQAVSLDEVLEGALVFHKEELVGRPFVIKSWDERTSKQYGNRMAVVFIATMMNGSRVDGVFAAGGSDLEDGKVSGIVGQLDEIYASMRAKGFDPDNTAVTVAGGLRSSTYMKEIVEDGKQKQIQATTYYLAAR